MPQYCDSGVYLSQYLDFLMHAAVLGIRRRNRKVPVKRSQNPAYLDETPARAKRKTIPVSLWATTPKNHSLATHETKQLPNNYPSFLGISTRNSTSMARVVVGMQF